VKTSKLFIALTLAMILALTSVSQAFASPVVTDLGEGLMAVTDYSVEETIKVKNPKSGKLETVTRSKKDLSQDEVVALGSGSGGTPSYSGRRTLTITTTYTLLGDPIAKYVTPFYWEWSNKRVTRFVHKASSYPRYSYFYFWAGETVGAPEYMYYNGVSKGQVYAWKRGHIEFRVTKFGVLYEMHPLHQIYARGNGTYYWKNTL
jgi:hypothetical protein